MSLYTFEIPDIAALDRLAKILAENLPAGTVVALNGTLGAG
jgi:tRNA A37 threonylcarbamoyladenosine biosynthesis protein TsaE